MNRMMAVAWREFFSTVSTKGFVLGVVLVPLLMLAGMLVVPLFMSGEASPVHGTVVVIDRATPEGEVGTLVVAQLNPEGMAERDRERTETAIEAGAELVEELMGSESAERLRGVSGLAGSMASGRTARILVETPGPDADPEAYKPELFVGDAYSGGLLALVVVDEHAVRADADGRLAGFELFVRPKLDERVQGIIIDATERSIRSARLREAGFDPARVNELMAISRPRVVTVTEEGERRTVVGSQYLLPIAFFMLLWISAFTGGQYLLTTTIEEKSNRVMEVLLSAVSPMQLMAGKIFGQMGVGLLILVVYSLLGGGALLTFSLLHLVTLENVALLLIFFFIAFFLIAALMAAIGSAVSDVHEAQSLLGPVWAVLMLPLLLSPAIIANPNSKLSVALSFVPPLNPFIMVLRIAGSTEPIPLWQIVLSILVGLASVYAAVWAAAKIFRIGVLMYGKPPNFPTLIKWIRMA